MAEIIYNGQSSKDFKIRIYNDLSHELSSRDIDTEVVPGRDGVLLVDNKRLKPVERAFPLKLIDDVFDKTTEISEWLGAKGWHELEFSWDEGFVYKATVINTISIKEVLKHFGRLQVVFLMHPIKYFKDNAKITLIKGQTVVNRGNVEAQPLIELIGNGNTTITINGRNMVLEDVQTNIILDMQNKMVYSGNLSAWDKVIREENTELPYLDIGNNIISWTGDFEMKMVKNEGVRI